MSEGNGFVTADDFRKRRGVRRFDVFDVDGFGKVRIRSLFEGERSRLEEGQFDSKGELRMDVLRTLQRRWIVACVVDADGNTVLDESDVEALDEVDGGITETIYRRIQKHQGRPVSPGN